MLINDLPEIRNIKGLDDEISGIINQLIQTWWRKRPRNVLRNRYYDGHNRLKDLGIAIPPKLKNIETYVGWPAKAVDYLADRTVLEGFTFNGVDNNDTLDGVMDENDFLSVYPQAVTDALTSSFSLISVTKGIEGEPSVIAAAHSARDSSVIWDFRLNRIKYALVVADVRRDPSGAVVGPSLINVFTQNEVITLSWRKNGRWVVEARQMHSQGQLLVEAIRYSPKLGRPLGRSRVSRPVMSLTDSMVRESLRSEISAEFFTAPQKYILGADDSLFDEKPTWEAYIGCLLAITGSDPDRLPQIGQLPQGSMQPHADYERQLAAQFSSETSIPISELGVIHDNPASADAIFEAKEGIVTKANNFNRNNRKALKHIGKLMIAVAENTTVDALPDDIVSIEPRFMNPMLPSMASRADAAIKIASVVPDFANSRVFWEDLGYDEAKIMRVMGDVERTRTKRRISDLMTQATSSKLEYQRGDSDGRDTSVASR